MKEIIFDHPHRKAHFDYFRNMENPHFAYTVNVDVSEFYKKIKETNISFTPALVYVLSRAANEIEQLRWRIRGDQVVSHDQVHPSYTVENDISDVFSFCYVPFQMNARQFIEQAIKNSEAMRQNPSFEDEEGRDDYLFMSANPWVHFTSIQHPMRVPATDSVPRIAWGKFIQQNGRLMMPLDLQAHHAVMDGKHMGQFFEGVQNYLSSSSWLA